MKFSIQTDAENDQLYLALSARAFAKGAVKRTFRVDDDIALDFGEDDVLLGVDVTNASHRLGRRWRDVTIDRLVGVTEASALLNVRPQNLLRDHVTQATFPAPVATLASGRVWLASQVEEYARARRRTHRKAS